MTDREEIMRAVADVVRERLEAAGGGNAVNDALAKVGDVLAEALLAIPEALRLDVPPPDLAPLAEAVDKLAAAQAEQNKLLRALVEKLQRAGPDLSPLDRNTAMLEKLVEKFLRPPAERKMRRLEIVHDDGTKSVVKEIDDKTGRPPA